MERRGKEKRSVDKKTHDILELPQYYITCVKGVK